MEIVKILKIDKPTSLVLLKNGKEKILLTTELAGKLNITINDRRKEIETNLILLIEGLEDAERNYGYDLANEKYYAREIADRLISSNKARADDPEKEK
jgi:hypothetical protein